MSTDFGGDSSSRFAFKARTNKPKATKRPKYESEALRDDD